jgi:hypothetical protein
VESTVYPFGWVTKASQRDTVNSANDLATVLLREDKTNHSTIPRFLLPHRFPT